VAGGGVSLKACKSCMLVRYCNANCQKNHWPTHKILCKQRAAELYEEALFKDPPPKEDCPICFLPMPVTVISCISLPPATIMSVPIFDFAIANEELGEQAQTYYSCCGKRICVGCVYSFIKSGNIEKCPYCNAEGQGSKTDEEVIEELMKRVEVNDAHSIYILGSNYSYGRLGLQPDQTKAIGLLTRAAELGDTEAHNQLGSDYREGGYLKKAKFHYEAAAMAGHEIARHNLGCMESNSGNMVRAIKHWKIAASSGEHSAMHALLTLFKEGALSRDQIDSLLIAYNDSCAEMRSEARDTCIQSKLFEIRAMEIRSAQFLQHNNFHLPR
jgi:tetratricopeptide (TPR) repeat protein